MRRYYVINKASQKSVYIIKLCAGEVMPGFYIELTARI